MDLQPANYSPPLFIKKEIMPLIADLQLLWLAGSLASGVYASLACANYKTIILYKREALRRHIYISLFLTAWFSLLVLLSIIAP